nr:homing endonuclease [Caudoviricetes sp.]
MIKRCAYCNKQYETDTHSKYCSDACLKQAEESRKLEYAKTKTRICERCGKEFIVPKLKNGNYSHKKYCSDECANNITKRCAYCNKQYETDTHSKYCSDACLKQAEESRKLEYAKTKTRICERCGKEFIVPKLKNGNYSHKKYCSDECANNITLNKNTDEYQPMKKCAYCGKMFSIPKYANGKFKYDVKYCSEQCNQDALKQWKLDYQKNKKRICVVCGKEFEVPRIADGHFSETVYCSEKCRYQGRSKSQNTANDLRKQTCLEKYGIPYFCLSEQCRQASNNSIVSNVNKNFSQKLKDTLGIDCEFEFTLENKAYDLKIKDSNTLIEINPTYTHTVIGNHYNNFKYNEHYINNQLNKTNLATKYGYHCIHVWDWDDWNKIINLIKPKEKLYARKLQLKEIDKQIANAFIDKYHIQGRCKGNTVNLGLYNINKTNLATKYGYHCIHVWDWDDWNKIINLIKPKEKLYARKLQLKEIDKQIANAFIDKYHIQGRCKGNTVNLGLYNNKQLVQVMTFGKPRYNKNYQWELLRLCTNSDYLIVGGAERLFKCFTKTYKPKSIISYCDISKFTGSVYYKLGFTLKEQTKPAKIWSKDDKRITDNLLRMRGFDQLFGTMYGKGTNNEELMLKHGWKPIYDCGQLVFFYKSEGNM